MVALQEVCLYCGSVLCDLVCVYVGGVVDVVECGLFF